MPHSEDSEASPAADDHNWPSVAGLSIFDQVLLAVIQANPDDHRKVTTGQRLAEARRALMGDPMAEGRGAIDDRLALNAMAEAESQYAARGEVVSAAVLARSAVDLTTGASPEATLARLVKRYNANRLVLAQELRYQDDIAVSVERQIVERLLADLRSSGVNAAEPSNQFKSPVVSLGPS